MSMQSNQKRLVSYGKAIHEAVLSEMYTNPDVLTFGIDVDDHVGIQGTTTGLQDIFGKDRVFSTPLSEDAMAGFAVGVAMAGMRPIHVHIRQDFLLLCMNQIINMAAKIHYMYGGKLRAPMVERAIIGKSWGQGPQHSQALYSLFTHIPGLKVVAPSNAYDAKGCMISAIRDDSPVIFTEHRLLYYTKAFVPQKPYEVPPGKARICEVGNDITLVGISNMVPECLRARELLIEKGISVEVIDPIWLMPLDMGSILNSVVKTECLLVVDNAWTNCGMSAEIIASIAETVPSNKNITMRRMGFAQTTCPTSPSIEEQFYPNAAKIASKIFTMLNPNKPNWQPNDEDAKLAYQKEFKGPF